MVFNILAKAVNLGNGTNKTRLRTIFTVLEFIVILSVITFPLNIGGIIISLLGKSIPGLQQITWLTLIGYLSLVYVIGRMYKKI